MSLCGCSYREGFMSVPRDRSNYRFGGVSPLFLPILSDYRGSGSMLQSGKETFRCCSWPFRSDFDFRALTRLLSLITALFR